MSTGLRRDSAGDSPILETASLRSCESSFWTLDDEAIVKDIDLTPLTQPLLASMAAASRAGHDHFSDAVNAIVRSRQFREIRGRDAE